MYEYLVCVRFGFRPFLEFVEGGESVLLFETVAANCYGEESGEKGEVGANTETGIEVVEQSCQGWDGEVKW